MPVGTHVYWLSHLWHSWLCRKAVLFADNRCHLLHHIIINTPCRGKDLHKSPPFTLSTSISRIMSAKVFAGVFSSESACLLTSSCHFMWLKRLACYCWVVFHHECLAAMTLVQETMCFFFICLPGSRLSENSFVWLKKKTKKKQLTDLNNHSRRRKELFSLPSAWHRYMVFISTTGFFFIHGNKSYKSKPRPIPTFYLFICPLWYLLPETPESVSSFFHSRKCAC